jgi:uncharacterized protein YjbI with pentapeptide repeats
MVDPSLSRFTQCHFKQSKLVGMDWTKAQWPQFDMDSELSFEECLMNDASFFGLFLDYIKLHDCKLVGVDFRDASLSQAEIINCDLAGALFAKTNLEQTDLTDTFNISIDVLNNRLNGAQFTRLEALSLLDSLNIKLVD